MSFWKSLFGKKIAGVSDTALSLESLSNIARENISQSLEIIEGQVKIEPGMVQVESTGSSGKIMEAVRKFEIILEQHRDNPLLHYAYASSLHLAMQYKSAEDEMKKCSETHPDFILAKLALEGWGKWQSMFTLPPWGTQTKTIHPALSQAIKTSILLPVRDGLVPRAALFLRDVRGDFQNIQALRSARITVASVISAVRYPQIIGIYAKVYDNPNNPFDIEVLQSPFSPRGDKTRATYEYLCIQHDIDFSVIDRNDGIMINKRLPIPSNMKETNQKILQLLLSSDGADISASQLMNAIMKHQQQFSPSNVRY
jgi:hypothetical protein